MLLYSGLLNNFVGLCYLFQNITQWLLPLYIISPVLNLYYFCVQSKEESTFILVLFLPELHDMFIFLLISLSSILNAKYGNFFSLRHVQLQFFLK